MLEHGDSTAEAPAAARQARKELAADGWDAPALARVVEIVAQRSAWLVEIAASPPSPVHGD